METNNTGTMATGSAALEQEVSVLRAKLQEAEETLRAIRHDEVDALIVETRHGDQVFSLRNADQPFRVFIEHMQEGAACVSAEGNISYANRAFADLVGQPLDRVIGAALADFVRESQHDDLRGLLAQAANGRGRREFALKNSEGGIVPAILSASAFLMEDVRAVCVIISDLREQRRSETIAASERLLRSVLDQSTEALIVCDAAGKILHASRAAAKICGDDPAGHPFERMFPLQSTAATSGMSIARSILTDLLRGRTVKGIELTMHGQGGEAREVLLSAGPLCAEGGSIVGAVITLVDHTEQRRHERHLSDMIERQRHVQEELRRANEKLSHAREQLRVEHQRFKGLFDAAPDGYIVTDDHAVIQHVNRAAAEMLGAAPDAIEEKSLAAFIRPESVPEFQARLGGIADTCVTRHWELQLHPRSGPPIDVEVSVAMARSSDGRPATLRWILRNIQVRKELEVEMQRKSRAIQESNSDLERFAAIAAHDLKEPLRSVHSFAELLTERYAGQLDSDGREMLGFVLEGARRMEAMITDLLKLARVGAHPLQPQTVSLRAPLDQALENLKASIDQVGAAITVEPLPEVAVDVTQIARVFQNLIGNALKFRGEQPCCIHVGAAAAQHEWHITIEDNGIGFEPRFAERIFEIFRQLRTSDRRHGTGIGLAICRKIVERHGGRIWAESEPGRGSRFTFALPMSRE